MTAQLGIDTGIEALDRPSHANDPGESTSGTTGAFGPPNRTKSAWRRFVDERRRQLHDNYPCAAPTNRSLCPKHHARVGQTTGICKPCRDELYEQLAGEYLAALERPKGANVIHDPEILEGELVPEVIEPGSPATLFRTSDPDVALQRMREVARTLVDVVEDRHLYATISRKRHLLVGAWTTLGGMLGVFPIVVWTRPNETNDGYLTRAEARTRDGQVIGAAKAECSRAERRWHDRDPYALRSMASTRAISRALRGPLEQIVVLAGYDPTAAEEMPVTDPTQQATEGTPPGQRPTSAQVTELNQLLADLHEREPGVDWPARARDLAGVPSWEQVTIATAAHIIDTLRAESKELARKPG